MKWSLERKILAISFGLAVSVQLAVNGGAYCNTIRLFERQKRVENSYEVLEKVRDLLATLRDAERARRGYIITGKESYLGTYNTAIKTIDNKLKQVRLSTAHTLSQQRRLDIIEPLIAERVALIKQSVALYKQKKTDTTTQIELTDKGILLHDKIGKIIDEIEAEETFQLKQKATQSQTLFQQTLIINILGSCFSLGLLFLVYFLLRYEIKNRQNIEEKLIESKQRYRHLFDITPHPLWVCEAESLAFLAVNQMAANYYGYSQQEFLSMKASDLLATEELHQFTAPICQPLPPGKRVARERHKKRDGTLIDVEIICHEFMFGNRPAKLILIRDITEEKLAQKALEASEEKFRQIAEHIHEVFWMSDVNLTKLLYINPAYEEIWGRSCQSVQENPNLLLDAIHPEDRPRVIENLHKNATTEFEIEYRIIRPDGSVRWIFDRSFPIKNSAGEVYRRAGVTQDITERKRVEEERRSLEKEREINELKLRFFSMASHEFRTPLSTILLSAQLLENAPIKCSPEKTLKNLHRIQSAARTMTQLLTDILTLTRAESGKLEVTPEALDLYKLCASLIEEIELNYRSKGRICFSSDCGCGELFTLDEKLLRSILTNLLSNAMKYSAENSPIYFRLMCEWGRVIFQIRDEGIGIAADDLQNLYESFYRGQNVGDVPGTGLGLAVVKKCVELHGGSISVQSQVGVGTVFTVIVPWLGGG